MQDASKNLHERYNASRFTVKEMNGQQLAMEGNVVSQISADDSESNFHANSKELYRNTTKNIADLFTAKQS